MVIRKNKYHVIVNTIVEFILCYVYFYHIHNFLPIKNVNILQQIIDSTSP